ncbi:dihydrofolate reductase family protein [bacterium 19CA06SA08-2]|uniref:Dihydrofolate reductase family protein n=1 Tax=bacterium 19CA06SA08-2 TaxID=2920658 RepID=A0AAU6U965_UNCXX
MMTRPEVTVFLAISLDGFIAREAHSLDWLTPYSSDPPDETGFNALMEHSDTLLMGRNTYDAIMGFGVWPYDGLRVRVMTHNPVEPRYQEQFVSGELSRYWPRCGIKGPVMSIWMAATWYVRHCRPTWSIR